MSSWGHRVEGWWSRRTIRSRLALWYAIGGTLLLAGFAATLYGYVNARMARPLDHQLRRDLAEVMRRLHADLGITSIRLLTSKKMTYVGLGGFGIEITATEAVES